MSLSGERGPPSITGFVQQSPAKCIKVLHKETPETQ